MKALIAAASAAALAALAPGAAPAQTANTGVYGTLGYAHTSPEGVDLGAIQGRVGWRANDWFGVEGELALGVKGDEVSIGGTSVDVDLERQAAIYAVGFAPIGASTDLIARIGYGDTKVEGSALGTTVSDDGDSWNFGVGAQHYFDGLNGVRADYTRYEFNDDGGHADVWSIGYTRRF